MNAPTVDYGGSKPPKVQSVVAADRRDLALSVALHAVPISAVLARWLRWRAVPIGVAASAALTVAAREVEYRWG